MTTSATPGWQEELAKYAVDPAVKAASREKFHFRPFEEAPPSNIDNETLELDAMDFSKFQEGPDGLESRQRLADQLERSLTKYGFFKIVNFGVSKEQIEEILSLSQSTFEEPEEVKKQYIAGEHNLPEEADRPLGVVRGTGYKPLGYWKYTKSTPDNVELFNVRHFGQYDTFFNKTRYPEFVRANLDDIAYYFNFIHQVVLFKVTRLIDLIMELPEGTVYENYFKIFPEDLTRSSNGAARFLLYHPVTDQYNKDAHSIWMRGHSDSGALTFILSQPILSLQIRDYETNQWKYVTHTPGALIVNIADMFQQLTGGYFRSSIHRVVTAPEDQRQYYRNTAIYFCSMCPDTYLDPEQLQSPKLERLGITRDLSLPRITARQWEDEKGRFFNTTSSNRTKNISFFGRESVGSLIGEEKPAGQVGVTS